MLVFFIVKYFIAGTRFSDIFHSLDVWHKTKSIKKCLAKVSITCCPFRLYLH